MTGLMRWMVGVIAGMMACGVARASEPSCYRSAAEAAAQVGVRGVEGYRLEAVRRDVFAGTVWAIVKSCGHPERPGVMVLTSLGTGMASGVGMTRPASQALVMLAGSRVRLVQTSENVQMEMSGVAQGSGAVGDRVRVRLVPVSLEGGAGEQASWATSERFATGVVRSRDLVEVEGP